MYRLHWKVPPCFMSKVFLVLHVWMIIWAKIKVLWVRDVFNQSSVTGEWMMNEHTECNINCCFEFKTKKKKSDDLGTCRILKWICATFTWKWKAQQKRFYTLALNCHFVISNIIYGKYILFKYFILFFLIFTFFFICFFLIPRSQSEYLHC